MMQHFADLSILFLLNIQKLSIDQSRGLTFVQVLLLESSRGYMFNNTCLQSLAKQLLVQFLISFYVRPPQWNLSLTRLNPFARSWFYNATAVRGALWWLRQSHSVNYANHQHSPFARRRHDVANSVFPGIIWKIRSAVPENGCLIFFADGKKTKKKQKQKKTSVKHIRIRLIGGCVNNMSRHDHLFARLNIRSADSSPTARISSALWAWYECPSWQ